MKCMAALLTLVLCCPAAHAGPIADRFASGVLGMQWGSSLDSLVGVLPQGDHVYATSPGNRGYLVKDDQDFLGVARRGHNIVYWFDENDRVESVTLSFPYERKDELMGALLSLCGHAGRRVTRGRSHLNVWGDDYGILISLKTTIEAQNGIAWLQISRTERPAAKPR